MKQVKENRSKKKRESRGAVMSEGLDLKGMDARIKAMKKAAEELKGMAGEFPAVYMNTSRVLASLKMLELNICDIMKKGLLP